MCGGALGKLSGFSGSGLYVAAGMFISTPLSSYTSHSHIIIFVLFSTLAAAHGGFFPHQTRFIRFSHTVGFCSLSTLAQGSRTRSHSGSFRSLSAFAHGSRMRSLSGSFCSQRFCTRFSYVVAFWQLSLSQRFRTWYSHAVAFWQLSLSALLHTVLTRGCFLAAFALSALSHTALVRSCFLAAFALSQCSYTWPPFCCLVNGRSFAVPHMSLFTHVNYSIYKNT